jgi:hypothetical protein
MEDFLALLGYHCQLIHGHPEKWPFSPISSLRKEILYSEYQLYTSCKIPSRASTLEKKSHFSR